MGRRTESWSGYADWSWIWSWKQGVGATKGTTTPSPGETVARKVLADLLHNDAETDHVLKSHTGTPGRHVINGTVPDHMDMMTEDQSRRRSGGTTMLQWTP